MKYIMILALAFSTLLIGQSEFTTQKPSDDFPEEDLMPMKFIAKWDTFISRDGKIELKGVNLMYLEYGPFPARCKSGTSSPDESTGPYTTGPLVVRLVHKSECCEFIFRVDINAPIDSSSPPLIVESVGMGPTTHGAHLDPSTFVTSGSFYIVVSPACDGNVLAIIEWGQYRTALYASCSSDDC